MTAATNGQRSSALEEHYADTHPNATPDLSFKILKQNNDVLRLHIEEALCIQTLNPLSIADKNTSELDFFLNSLLSVILFFSSCLYFHEYSFSLLPPNYAHLSTVQIQTHARIHTHTDYNPVHYTPPCSFIFPIPCSR